MWRGWQRKPDNLITGRESPIRAASPKRVIVLPANKEQASVCAVQQPDDVFGLIHQESSLEANPSPARRFLSEAIRHSV